MQFLIKTIISATIIALASELAKRSSAAAAVLISLPLTSILALIWLYRDTHDTEKITNLSHGIFWTVLPSLLFFWILPFLLKMGLKFPAAMAFSCVSMALGYGAYLFILNRLGISF